MLQTPMPIQQIAKDILNDDVRLRPTREHSSDNTYQVVRYDAIQPVFGPLAGTLARCAVLWTLNSGKFYVSVLERHPAFSGQFETLTVAPGRAEHFGTFEEAESAVKDLVHDRPGLADLRCAFCSHRGRFWHPASKNFWHPVPAIDAIRKKLSEGSLTWDQGCLNPA